MPVFRYNEALDVVQNVKAFLSEKKSKRQEFKRLRDDIENKRREFFRYKVSLLPRRTERIDSSSKRGKKE